MSVVDPSPTIIESIKKLYAAVARQVVAGDTSLNDSREQRCRTMDGADR